MKFPFNEKKAAQAAACFIRLHGGWFDYLSLIKMLYLADRQALLETGVPITGDRMVSLDYGPVLSTVKDCLNGKSTCAVWTQFVSTTDNNYTVRLVDENTGTDELSDYELDVIEAVYAQHGNKSAGQLIDFGHTLPEWEDPKGSCREIPPERIFEKAGLPVERSEEAAEYALMAERAVELGSTGL